MRASAFLTIFLCAYAGIGCSVVVSPIDYSFVANTSTSIAFSGYLQEPSAPVYLQVANVDNPSPANTAHWQYVNPGTGALYPTGTTNPAPLATTSASPAGTFDSKTGYAWAATLTIAAAGWRAGTSSGSQAIFIIRTATDWNSGALQASDSVQCNLQYVSGSTPAIRCGSTGPLVTTVDEAIASSLPPIRAATTPMIHVRTTNYHNVGDPGCNVTNAVGECRKGKWGAGGTCTQTTFPQSETCSNNNEDNDCNGITDDIPMLNTACDARPLGCQEGFIVPGEGRMICNTQGMLVCTPKSSITTGPGADPLRISDTNHNGIYCSTTSATEVPGLCGASLNGPCITPTASYACQPGMACLPSQGAPGPTTTVHTCTTAGHNSLTMNLFFVCEQSLFNTTYPMNVPSCWLPWTVSGGSPATWKCCNPATTSCDTLEIMEDCDDCTQ